tara:strand:+ start:1974 stop:2483 length:510 start_codon:yes stop_codon:yes gene_type:complete
MKDSVEGIKSQNRFVWDNMKETDPRFTKRVNKGFGEITTIDPQWQIMRMTEMFGPVGKGWNYTVNYTYTNDLVFAEVLVATSKTENEMTDSFWNYYGPICSVQKLFRKTGALDDEAPKKAMTDALTKAFSHLGLCSDIFMGKFDDSKYVQKLEEKYSGVADKKKISKTV